MMKISIITVCRNAQDTIEETIKSVLMQTYNDIDYIIIDGKSTDYTLHLLQKYQSKISTIVSEKDKGIYDAMNKGIEKAKGEIIHFLNSGDTLYNKNIISHIVQVFKNEERDIVYGDVVLIDPSSPNKKLLKCHKYADDAYLTSENVCHQGIFTKKQVFTKYGGFNTKYKLAADFDWFLRSLFKYKIDSYYTDKIIANFLLGGVSMSGNPRFLMGERKEILSSYFSRRRIILNILKMKFRNMNIYYRHI